MKGEKIKSEFNGYLGAFVAIAGSYQNTFAIVTEDRFTSYDVVSIF